jgi:hypothetical protein
MQEKHKIEEERRIAEEIRQQIHRDHLQCFGYGFKEHSVEFANCNMQLDLNRKSLENQKKLERDKEQAADRRRQENDANALRNTQLLIIQAQNPGKKCEYRPWTGKIKCK